MAPRSRNGGASNDDRTGLDETANYLALALSKFVPGWLARRAVTVSVTTDRDTYRIGEPVTIVVEFKNRLPLPVSVPTPESRLWGWTVDGLLEATDERRYTTETPSSFEFRGGERKRVVHEWNGRLRRTGSDDAPDVSEPVAPGEHEIRAFLATGSPDDRPEDGVTITVERRTGY